MWIDEDFWVLRFRLMVIVPKYFFNVYRSREPPRIDQEGQRFADDAAACQEATKVAAECVTDLKDKFEIGMNGGLK